MTDNKSSAIVICCPPPCSDGKRCIEEAICTPEICEYKGSWKHTAYHVKHHCAHDFQSGEWIEFENGGTASCVCGMTAMSHDMRYAP